MKKLAHSEQAFLEGFVAGAQRVERELIHSRIRKITGATGPDDSGRIVLAAETPDDVETPLRSDAFAAGFRAAISSALGASATEIQDFAMASGLPAQVALAAVALRAPEKRRDPAFTDPRPLITATVAKEGK